ncbi:MAG: DUF4249 family protein [Bacteroidales bacterium]|nr:DUF4249 family protein [Bacteroidales bacterium]
MEYGEKILSAVTTIPPPVFPDSIWFEPISSADSMGKIKMVLNDNPDQHNYYRLYSKISTQQDKFYPVLMSNFDDKYFNGTKYTFHINKGPESYLDINSATFYYKRGDTVSVKIATIDSATHAFWYSYNSEVSNGANPFASSYHKVESNIDGPGKGIWGGYGSAVFRLIANKKTGENNPGL